MARNYVHERLIEKPERVKERAQRNKARRLMKAKVGAAALAGKEVDHKNSNPRDSSLRNLRVVSVKENDTGRAGGSKFKKGGK